MTVAEIRGKISSSGSNISDRMEDLLTSDVFGPLRYLPFAEGLLPILSQAQNYHSGKTLEIGDSSSEVRFHFWPRLEKSEPDVLIECGDHLLMIEAKYMSGKSGNFDEDEEQNGDNEVAASSDQLAREFQDLEQYDGNFSKRSLLYVTAHRVLPKEDIESSHKAISQIENAGYALSYRENTYWLSWVKVHDTIEKLSAKKGVSHHETWILKDIKCLLDRKGLRTFRGFMDIQEVTPTPREIFYLRLQEYDWSELTKVFPVPENVFYQRNG